MSTAAVGLSPKMVVRSLTDDRGSAEAPLSSRRVSLFTVPLALPPGAGVVTAGLSVVVVVVEDEEPDADGADGAAGLADGAAGLDGLVELELLELACANVSVTGAASTATPSRATKKDFIPHLLGGYGARPVPLTAGAVRRLP
jgi:hypothetical protein